MPSVFQRLAKERYSVVISYCDFLWEIFTSNINIDSQLWLYSAFQTPGKIEGEQVPQIHEGFFNSHKKTSERHADILEESWQGAGMFLCLLLFMHDISVVILIHIDSCGWYGNITTHFQVIIATSVSLQNYILPASSSMDFILILHLRSL